MTPSHSVRSIRVLVDTSAYFAAANRRDAAHEQASTTLRRLVEERRRLSTTNFTLAELHALLLTRVDRQIASQVLAEVDASRSSTVVRVSARDEQRAREIISQYDDKDFSLTDATSFAVTEWLRTQQAFTLDRNFTQYGWTVIGEVDQP